MVVTLVLAAIFAVAGYQEARRFGRQYGRTPWGWDPAAWAAALGLSFIVGIVLLAVAERQGRASFTRGAVASVPEQGAAAPSQQAPTVGTTILPGR